MAEDLIRYDILAQDALRGLVRKVMSEVARTGLPGDHHFFVTFATTAPGVRISTRLLAQYPEEMTIVVQHQYWDLIVTEHAFEIGLSFNGIPERLFVPFGAVKTFADPSVGFQLQFAVAMAPVAVPASGPVLVEDAKPTVQLVPPAETKPEPAVVAPKPAAVDDTEEAAQPGRAEVVSLDAFRKK
jgi:hypothetical protein